jgi:hypothetical protein
VANGAMTGSALPTHRSKRRPSWMYLVFGLAALGLLSAVALLAGIVWLSAFFIPKYVETPHISGKVVDALTGAPVPEMDVCFLETFLYTGPSDNGPGTYARRTEVTRTDAAGMFYFAASKSQRDWFQEREQYAIGISDPSPHIKVCGIGDSQNKSYPPGPADTAGNNRRHYFPAAIVKDPANPYPMPPNAPVGYLSGRSFIQKMGDPGDIKVALIPLLRNGSECQSPQDPGSAELCRQANESGIADDMRKEWKFLPERR